MASEELKLHSMCCGSYAAAEQACWMAFAADEEEEV